VNGNGGRGNDVVCGFEEERRKITII